MRAAHNISLQEELVVMGEFGNPASTKHGRFIKNVKGRAKTLACWHKECNFGWMDMCKEVIGVGYDTKALRRIGLAVEFTPELYSRRSDLDPFVPTQDALMQLCQDFCVAFVGFLSVDGMEVSNEYPSKLGRIIEEDDAALHAFIE